MSDLPRTEQAARLEAFRAFVEPEIEVLLRVAGAMTAHQADAEDLVQETLVKAFRAVDRFDGRHPRAWLLTILRNTHANSHRRRRPGTVGEWELLRTARPAFGRAELPSAEDTWISEELTADLGEALESLSAGFRAVVILIDVHDLTYAEAATVLDVPVGTVMSRLSRARGRLRKRLSATHERGAPS